MAEQKVSIGGKKYFFVVLGKDTIQIQDIKRFGKRSVVGTLDMSILREVCRIKMLYVAPVYRKKGLARYMLEYLVNRAENENVKEIRVFPNPYLLNGEELNYEKVYSFYSHFGFKMDDPTARRDGPNNEMVNTVERLKNSLICTKGDGESSSLQIGGASPVDSAAEG